LDEVKKQLETIFKLDDSINSWIKDNTFSPLYQRGAGGDSNKSFIIIYCSPSKIIFNQNHAEEFSKYENIIFISGRYEWIDKRFEDYIDKKYPWKLKKISIGQFITMWWESPSMVMIEAISRLIPWVIKEEESHINESYSTAENMKNIEHPYYTRPEEVYWMKVPDVLISGHHKNIEKRKEDNAWLMSE
jgi:tRNA (guanine37-N1)-methyltransferase